MRSLLMILSAIGLSRVVAAPDISQALNLEAEQRSYLHFDQERATQRQIIKALETFETLPDEAKAKLIEEHKRKHVLLNQRLEYKDKAISDAIDAAGMGNEAIQKVEAIARDFLSKNLGKENVDEVVVDSAFRIGSDVEQFANKGDVIWEVRLDKIKSGLLWINPKTQSIQTIGIFYKDTK